MPGVSTLSGPRVGWEHFPHGADIGIRGWGRNVTEAFEQAATATTAIVADPVLVRSETSIDITCEASALEDLLVEWLNAVIFEMAHRHLVFGSFSVSINDHRLVASARGEALDSDRHDWEWNRRGPRTHSSACPGAMMAPGMRSVSWMSDERERARSEE